MSDPQWPSSVRSAWRIGIIVGYGMALAVFLMRLLGGDLPLSLELPGAISLGLVAAVSPTLALLAYPRRPGLLLPAGAIAVLSLPVMSVFGFPMLVIGLIWLWAQNRVGGWAPSGSAAALLAAVVLWFGATWGLFIHLDPACVQTLRDGTVQEVDPVERGFQEGWVWDVDSNTFSGSDTIGADVISGACTSNSLVLWEALASSALSIGAVLASWHLTKPSPVTASPASLSV